MRLENVVRFTSANIGRSVGFGRAPKKGYEEKEYSRTIQDALHYLGVQNRALIIHGTSFPAQEGNYDIEVGTPLNADELVEFAKLHGFNAIQLGPNGKLNKGDTSPYTSSVFEKNPLFIDFNRLMAPNYASILSEKDIEKVARKTKTNGKDHDKTDFGHAQKNADELINIAFANFKTKLEQNDSNAIALAQEFGRFENENSAWINHYAILNVLSSKNGTDYYPYWPQEDQDLIQDVKKGDRLAISRYSQIEKDNANEIEKYKFTQFLIDKQTKADNIARGDFGYISDLEVGASSLDELVFKDAFLSDYKIGCKYGGPLNSPQLWGIAMPDPNKLFNEDGSLGPSGQFIKAKLQNGLSGAQSIRIDHAMGLVNPYLYKPSSVQYGKKFDKGHLVEYPIREKLHAGYLSELGIDRNHNYEKVLSRIILPTMKEMGVNPHHVIWEDLGNDETGMFNKVFKQQHRLPGISGMIWTKGVDAKNKRENWAYIGCHDNKPGRRLIEDGDIEKREGWKPDYLAGALRPDPYKGAEREALRHKIQSSPKERWKAKVAELFNSTKHIQISFMDFFGINKAYNTPGTSGGDNWTLRLNSDFKDTYYKSLEQDKGWAINMPETLKTAVQAKFDEDVSKNGKPYWETKAQIDPLLARLDHWENVLKEKEN